MSTIWDKLDSGLAAIYSEYLQVKECGAQSVPQLHPVVAGGGRLNVSLQYTGDLAEIEARGFQTVWEEESGWATGTVDLADLQQLAAHPGVHKMSFGQAPDPLLDKSVPDIRANQVWSFAAGAFSGSTGAGAIVGIIDTGIDFRHPYFLKTSAPVATRILRIWDPGLVPVGAETSPPAALLSSGGPSYGVEYTDAMINAVLQGVGAAAPVRHRDCSGHGTHVASIAGGDGRSAYKYIGVAPEADLIVVKYLYLETHPAVGGPPPVPVPYGRLFRDAVSYILNVANGLGRPVVINGSFGSNLGPHDGFTDNEDWLADKFNGATGKVLVSAAGNDGGNRQHARIEFPPAGGTVDIPLELYDNRGAKKIEFNRCVWEWGTQPLALQLYYAAGGPSVSAELDIPRDNAGFRPGPALGAPPPPPIIFGGRRCTMRHAADNQLLRGGRCWVAYRRQAGILRRVHLGKPQQLNRQCLDEVVSILNPSPWLSSPFGG